MVHYEVLRSQAYLAGTLERKGAFKVPPVLALAVHKAMILATPLVTSAPNSKRYMRVLGSTLLHDHFACVLLSTGVAVFRVACPQTKMYAAPLTDEIFVVYDHLSSPYLSPAARSTTKGAKPSRGGSASIHSRMICPASSALSARASKTRLSCTVIKGRM